MPSLRRAIRGVLITTRSLAVLSECVTLGQVRVAERVDGRGDGRGAVNVSQVLIPRRPKQRQLQFLHEITSRTACTPDVVAEASECAAGMHATQPA